MTLTLIPMNPLTHRCVFALRPDTSEQDPNVTRNVVFQEVLTGIRQEAPAPPEEAVLHEVDDIDQQWFDYDTMDVEGEDMIHEEALTERGPDAQDEVRRRVAGRKRQPTKRSQKQRVQGSWPTIEPVIGDEPLCEYEQIRERNIRERDALFYEKFGYHLRDGRSILTELLGQEEGDSEIDEEEEQVRSRIHCTT